jgi:S1-C subfamily serine protease
VVFQKPEGRLKQSKSLRQFHNPNIALDAWPARAPWDRCTAGKEAVAASLGLNNARGIIISQVQPGSAAERAGMKQSDVILAPNGNAVSDPNSFRNEIAATPTGRTITLRSQGVETNRN